MMNPQQASSVCFHQSGLTALFAGLLFVASAFAGDSGASLEPRATPNTAVITNPTSTSNSPAGWLTWPDLAGLQTKSVRVMPSSGDVVGGTGLTPMSSQPGDLHASDATLPADQQGAGTGEWVVAPIPFLKPAIGWGLGLGAAYLYRPSWVGSNSPPWETGGGGFYSENESWGAGVVHRMNWDEDRWRLLGAGAYGVVRYDFFGVGVSQGDANTSIPLRQQAAGGSFELLRQVQGRWYVGGRYLYGDIRSSVDGSTLNLPPYLQGLALEQQARLSALGLRVQRDTRDSKYYPTHGSLLDIEADFFAPAWGSDYEYQNYGLAYNHYHRLREQQVLAFRAMGKSVSDGAPFFALASFGTGADLRGYTPGRYQDQVMFAVQAEYRLRLGERFGVVAFGGVGGVAPDFGGFETLLPSIGTGVRYVIAKQNNISLRFDVAWGRKDHAFYLGVGEAF